MAEAKAATGARMLRGLILLHRWLGVAFCLFFAMWFASGAVMHFVHYPSLTEAERLAGLAPFDTGTLKQGPGEAIRASGLTQQVSRVRLLMRADGPIYVVQAGSGLRAVKADDLSPATVMEADQAFTLATDHVRRRGLETAAARYLDRIDVDQWTVAGGSEKHRPLHRIALEDAAGTEIYVSSTTGEVLRDTTRRERFWNYAGTVAHLVYPTVLRRDYAAWDITVWWLSLAALVTAMLGGVLGLLRLRRAGHLAGMTPFSGWKAWHHGLGLLCASFLLTWMFSGWVTMDHGRLFSTGKLDAKEAAVFNSAFAVEALPANEPSRIPPQVREVEWLAFNGRIHRRERFDLTTQTLVPAGVSDRFAPPFFGPVDVTELIGKLDRPCSAVEEIRVKDVYTFSPSMPNAPVYRVVCGDDWFHVSGANGALQGKFDPSRRAYRWIQGSLHGLEFPFLAARPWLRTATILVFCGLGFAFSLTGVTIAWRRLGRRPA